MVTTKPPCALLQLGNSTVYLLRQSHSFYSRLLGWHARGSYHGVWLLPCSAIQTFTVQQPFDLIWLNKRLEILRLDFMVPPNRIVACWRAHSVIELPAGALTSLQESPHLVLQGDVK